MASAPKHVGES